MRSKVNGKFILLFAFVFTLAFSSAAQTSPVTKENEELRKLRSEVVTNYDEGQYDEALHLAQLALALSIKLQGEEGRDTAASYFNIGKILKAQKQNKTAIENFERSLAIHQKKFPEDKKMLLAIYGDLGFLNYLEKNKAEAEKYFIIAVKLSEELNGAESKETLSYLDNLGTFYEAIKEPVKAEPYLWRAVKLSNKLYGRDDPRAENMGDHYSCFLNTNHNDEIKKLIAERSKDDAVDRQRGNIRSVINGKAKNLGKPVYPYNYNGPRGQVMVRVTIGIFGTILKAKAYCGPQALWDVSERAARISTFSATTLDGKPVEVTGIIVYNYQ